LDLETRFGDEEAVTGARKLSSWPGRRPAQAIKIRMLQSHVSVGLRGVKESHRQRSLSNHPLCSGWLFYLL
jgi:hypothetical protein